MKEWKVEEQLLTKEAVNGGVFVGKNRERVWKWESEFSDEEKIAFIDEYYELYREKGIASYMVNLLNKYQEEKETLPKDTYGNVKTVSLKAWLKRNDTRNIIDSNYHYGEYKILKHDGYIDRLTAHCRYGTAIYEGQSLVKQWFHDLLNELYYKEIAWFKENDGFQIKLSKLREMGRERNEVFNCKELNDIVYNSKEDVLEERVDLYLSIYQELDQKVNEISSKLREIGCEMYTE